MKNYSPGKNLKLPVAKDPQIRNLTGSFYELQDKINFTIKELHQLESYRKDFVDNITHELKTPLTTIQGFLETLENGAIEDPQERDHFLMIIKKNTLRLTALVDDILKLSKIENSKKPKDIIDAKKILLQIIEEYNLKANSKITIKIANSSLKTLGAADEIYSAMSNYINNALKYCPNSPIIINLQNKNSVILFEVTDHGPGISQDSLSRLFERFYRPDKNRSREFGGTGLGLSIVKNVIKKHGGKYGADSQPGKGSNFWFTLPLKP